MGAMAVDTPIVQASSLANIISLADAPPQRPTPRHRRGTPLELYIARVPGSRDIFLTTLKPRDKVVTAQDIENCLYYCHLETENDDLFRHEDDYFGESANGGDGHESEVPSSPTSQDEPNSPVARARAPSLPPLPERPLALDSDHYAPAPVLPPRPEHLTVLPAVKRKPVNGSHEHIEEPTSHAPVMVPILPPRPVSESQNSPYLAPKLPQRPLGPRPLSERRQSENIGAIVPPLVTDLSARSVRSEHFEQLQQPPTIPRRPVSVLSPSPQLNGQRQSPLTNGHSPYFGGHAPFQPLVRPHGQGKENSDSGRWPDQPYSHLGHDPPPPVPFHSFDKMQNFKPSSQPGSLSPRSTTSSLKRTNSIVSNIPAGFNRTNSSPHDGFNVTLIRRNPATSTQQNVGKITIPATNSHYKPASKVLLQIFTPGYTHFRSAPSSGVPLTTSSLVRCISEDDDCTFSTDLRLATRRRSIKGPSSPYFGDVPVNQLISVSPSQPYSFLGPWNRVCEFGTGVRGKSLKCRHMLGTGMRHALGSDEKGRNGRGDSRKEAMSVVELSELRFNTPSTGLWAKSKQQDRRPRTRSAVGNSATDLQMKQSAVHRKSVPATSLHSHSHTPSSAFGNSSTHLHHHAHEHHEQQSRHHPFVRRSSHDDHAASPSTFTSHSEEPDQDWDVEPMDLSLGQELAGGGFKGNKAKLGKLVVEPEGLEMLDLLVAANMGVWWSIR